MLNLQFAHLAKEMADSVWAKANVSTPAITLVASGQVTDPNLMAEDDTYWILFQTYYQWIVRADGDTTGFPEPAPRLPPLLSGVAGAATGTPVPLPAGVAGALNAAGSVASTVSKVIGGLQTPPI